MLFRDLGGMVVFLVPFGRILLGDGVMGFVGDC